MAAANIGNPAGAVCLLDGGNPRIIGGYARNAIISGGVFVFASGAEGVVSSGLNSYVTSDLLFAGNASGAQFNGICLQTTDTSGAIAVATKGTFLLACVGSVIPGMPVACEGTNCVTSQPFLAGSPTVINAIGHQIGRAVTAGASGGYAVIDLGA